MVLEHVCFAQVKLKRHLRSSAIPVPKEERERLINPKIWEKLLFS